MGALDGRTAVITGVSRPGGIGAAVAGRLAGEGARLWLTGWPAHDEDQPWDADPTGGEGVRDGLRAEGANVHYASVDLADPQAPQQVMSAATAAFGHVDLLVVNHARSSRQSLSDLTAAELDLSFAVNARASLLMVRHFAAQHDSPVGGRIVLFTSGQYHGAMPDELPYIASKAVVQQLTASLSVTLAPRAITVNCINPGPNDTGYAGEELGRAVVKAIPGRRWGRPEDAARLVAWLCSDDAEWVTGQTIASDGGWSARGAG